VDSIETRKHLFKSCGNTDLFIDGRMSAEVLRVISAADPGRDTFYETTLFSEAEAFRGSCTAKSTVYTASIAAGLMLGQFTRWLRGLPLEKDILFNIGASELVVA
jgi:sulfur carrier protein ThiS adenylyltransferase